MAAEIALMVLNSSFAVQNSDTPRAHKVSLVKLSSSPFRTTGFKVLNAKIISCGNLVEGLKDNDTIYYDKHAGHDISWKDTLYRVIRDVDVVLVD